MRKYRDFLIFSRWQLSAILDLWRVRNWTHPQSLLGSLYCCAKFGWNRCSRFDTVKVLVFRTFGLNKPIQAPKIGVLGFFYPLNWERSQQNPQKASVVAKTRHLVQRSSKLVQSLRRYCDFSIFSRSRLSAILDLQAVSYTHLTLPTNREV